MSWYDFLTFFLTVINSLSFIWKKYFVVSFLLSNLVKFIIFLLLPIIISVDPPPISIAKMFSSEFRVNELIIIRISLASSSPEIIWIGKPRIFSSFFKYLDIFFATLNVLVASTLTFFL